MNVIVIINLIYKLNSFRSSPQREGKGVLKMCKKFTGEYPCRSVISIYLESNFTEITLWHGWSPVN